MQQQKLSKSQKAGLVFPVAKIGKFCKMSNCKSRISAQAPVYIAGVLEETMKIILEASAQLAEDKKSARITPRILMLAISQDQELTKYFKDCVFSQSGVTPHIEEKLQQRSGKDVKGKKVSTLQADSEDEDFEERKEEEDD